MGKRAPRFLWRRSVPPRRQERNIRTDFYTDLFQLFAGKMSFKQAVERGENRCTVSTSAAKSCHHRDSLDQMNYQILPGKI